MIDLDLITYSLQRVVQIDRFQFAIESLSLWNNIAIVSTSYHGEKKLHVIDRASSTILWKELNTSTRLFGIALKGTLIANCKACISSHDIVTGKVNWQVDNIPDVKSIALWESKYVIVMHGHQATAGLKCFDLNSGLPIWSIQLTSKPSRIEPPNRWYLHVTSDFIFIVHRLGAETIQWIAK